ncbi:nitroreductase family protein [Paraburkholderia sp. DHOC27]|uniref:nitroreductase family protein n=1 Tax=Paraburkholderia sp. DHOC27 TaxID=2303330 RepID=UPI000E3DE444|nr:nitroreductase family protein [Paraburkholderia sp. DHOC27]RFU45058.1 nitroreductase family protein [Paraburkholderia sp. DHOC27]
MTTSNPRTSEYPIDNQFLDRWSPRAFTGEAIPEATLLTFFEAARWAPSCFNSQPWRFIYARRDTEHWERFLGFLNSFNQGWGQHASAIVIVLSKTTFAAPGTTEEKPAPTHSFDAGAAWGYLALQASLSGWHAHGLGGIEHDKIRKELALPDNYAIEAGVVIGKLGDKSSLPEALQAREVQSPRNPLSAIAIEGRLVP